MCWKSALDYLERLFEAAPAVRIVMLATWFTVEPSLLRVTFIASFKAKLGTRRFLGMKYSFSSPAFWFTL